MQYTKDFNIYEFEFWGGAKAKTDDMTFTELQALGDYLEVIFEYDTPSETDINDFVWFEELIVLQDTYGAPQAGCETRVLTLVELEDETDVLERIEQGYARYREL